MLYHSLISADMSQRRGPTTVFGASNQPNVCITLMASTSICPNTCSSMSQSLIHSRRQLVLDHPRENHEIFSHDQQLIRQHLSDLILVHPRVQILPFIADADNSPHDDMANIAGDNWWDRRKCLGRISNVRNRTSSSQGNNIEIIDSLLKKKKRRKQRLGRRLFHEKKKGECCLRQAQTSIFQLLLRSWHPSSVGAIRKSHD